jgi:hypothetical protein
MSKVALQALGMIDLAVDGIAFASQGLRCEIAMLALTHLAVHTVAIAAALRAIGDVTNWPIPAKITLANVGSDRIPMLAGWITRRDIACCPLVAVEADAGLRCRADPVFAVGAHSDCTNSALPTFLAYTVVRAGACAKDAWRLTDWGVAIDTCPTVVALTALTLVLVIGFET